MPGSHMWSDPGTKNTATGKNTQDHGNPSRGCPARRGSTAVPTSNTANVHTHTVAATLATTTPPAVALSPN